MESPTLELPRLLPLMIPRNPGAIDSDIGWHTP